MIRYLIDIDQFIIERDRMKIVIETRWQLDERVLTHFVALYLASHLGERDATILSRRMYIPVD